MLLFLYFNFLLIKESWTTQQKKKKNIYHRFHKNIKQYNSVAFSLFYLKAPIIQINIQTPPTIFFFGILNMLEYYKIIIIYLYTFIINTKFILSHPVPPLGLFF